MNIKEELLKICPETSFNESMKEHTTFKVGGEAKYFSSPSEINELISLIKFAKENNIEYFILGKGSDLLVSDSGFAGLIISTKNFSNISLLNETTLEVGAGLKMRDISDFALENNLTGFEFAAGIPGSLGGAVFMNAGAYDGEMKDVLVSVKVLEANLNVKELDLSELDFSYRFSNINEKKRIVLSAKISLKKGEYEKIKEKVEELDFRRKDKQPLDYPSAGSTFKRPKGYFAGKLISDANLQGFCIGDACVSTKHAGFIINRKNALAKDVYSLIKHVQNIVFEKFGVELEPEVKFLGEF